MANNRMYPVNNRTGSRVFIGKYFPSQGWGTRPTEGGSLEQRLDEAFDADPCTSALGPLDWQVEYEHTE